MDGGGGVVPWRPPTLTNNVISKEGRNLLRPMWRPEYGQEKDLKHCGWEPLC